MTAEDINALYDRLRETEAQTREQSQQIAALTKRVDTMLERFDAHMKAMWKLVYILVSAIVAVAICPNAKDKLKSAFTDEVTRVQPIAPWEDHGHARWAA